MGYSPPRPPPRYDVTTMSDVAPQYVWGTTGERDRLLEEICYGATPCVYCGRKAPADVYQCLGCGAPR
jgi:hypothetical protein